MKRVLYLIISGTLLFGSEFQFGRGDFNVEANFLGLNGNKSEKISTYSIVNEHKNIFSTKFFISYKLSYYKSKTLKTSYFFKKINGNWVFKSIPFTSNTNIPISGSNNSTSGNNNSSNLSQSSNLSLNSLSANSNQIGNVLNQSNLNNDISLFKTLIYSQIEGVDLNGILGVDFINQDNQDTYLGAGILVGVTFPTIKTKSNNSSDLDYLKKSKTKLTTYKLGLSIKGQRKMNGFIDFYASTAYAFQTAKVKNSVLNLNASSNGDYFTFNTGIKFQAKTKKKIGFVTLSPAVFATIGYRYDYWKVNNIKINSLNIKTDIEFKISQLYVGLGYDF